MALPQLIDKPIRQKRPKNLKGNSSPSISKLGKIDAFSLASEIQRHEEKREYLYSWVSLFMKVGLLAIFSASFVKLGLASHQRVRRHVELSSVLEWESERLEKLNKRFDQLFTLGGERRFMNEQDQWIAPNSVRVIWR